MTQNAVFWLRDDFRIEDNPALSYASSNHNTVSVSYTHLRAHETGRNLVCRLLLEKKQSRNC